MDKRELLKSLGFSEKLLEKLENHEASMHEVTLPSVDMTNMLFDQYDLNNLVIKKENVSTQDIEVITT